MSAEPVAVQTVEKRHTNPVRPNLVRERLDGPSPEAVQRTIKILVREVALMQARKGQNDERQRV